MFWRVLKISGQSRRFPYRLEDFGQHAIFLDSLKILQTVWQISVYNGRFPESMEDLGHVGRFPEIQ